MSCSTKDEAEDFLNYLVDEGLITSTTFHDKLGLYGTYKNGICYRPHTGGRVGHCYESFYVIEGYSILKASEFEFGDNIKDVSLENEDSVVFDKFLCNFVR